MRLAEALGLSQECGEKSDAGFGMGCDVDDLLLDELAIEEAVDGCVKVGWARRLGHRPA